MFNLSAENSAIAYDEYNILIAVIGVLKILIILFWVSFKLIKWGFATFFIVHRHATATTYLWVD